MSDLWIPTLQQHPSHCTKDEVLVDSDNSVTVLVAISQFLSLTLCSRRVTSVKRRPFSYPTLVEMLEDTGRLYLFGG